MVRLKSQFICSICNERGGTIGKRPVRTSIQLPKLARIMKCEYSPEHSEILQTMKLSDSFEFAAKTQLALERRAICVPPISKKDDDRLASSIYERMKSFDPHTDIEREQFEARWSKERSIERRIIKDERSIAKNDLKKLQGAMIKDSLTGTAIDYAPAKRTRTPRADVMHVSRTSIAYRYAAILLTAVSKLVDSGMIELSRSIDAFATYNVFSCFTYRIDGRYRRSLGDWGKILDTRIQHGYNARFSTK